MLRARTPLSPLCAFGHVATHAELLEEFHGQESAVIPFRMGRLTAHPRVNVYVCAHLDEAEMSAAWCGGLLDCVTVLASVGLPVDHVGELHLRIARGDSRAAARRMAQVPTAHMHWSRLRTRLPTLDETRHAAIDGEPLSRLRVPVREALRQAMTSCLSYAESAEVIAAATGTTSATAVTAACSAADVAHAIATAPRRVERALRELDAIPGEIDIALAALRSGHHF